MLPDCIEIVDSSIPLARGGASALSALLGREGLVYLSRLERAVVEAGFDVVLGVPKDKKVAVKLEAHLMPNYFEDLALCHGGVDVNGVSLRAKSCDDSLVAGHCDCLMG